MFEATRTKNLNSAFAPFLKACHLQFVTIAGSLLLCATQAFCAELSVEEQLRATAIAHKLAWRSERSNTPATAHPLAVQTLSVEATHSKNQPDAAHVKVYQFSYIHQSARVVNIDLQNSQILSQQSIASVHLPLSETEIQLAKQLLSQDALLTNALQAEQHQRGHPVFNSVVELSVKASIFEPTLATHACALERCALLSLFDDSNTVFATEPLVNLNSGLVSTLQASQ